MNKTIKLLTTTIISFGAYFILHNLLFSQLIQALNSIFNVYSISYVIAYIAIGIPIFLAMSIIHKPKDFFQSIGLKKEISTGLIFAFICILPMLIGYALIFNFNFEITLKQIVVGALAAAFFEELYFRGYFFGQIYRFTRFGFTLSLIIPSLIFASAHLYQSQELSTVIGVFITTLLGSALFAWTYIEWDNNLWVPIFLHLFMNLLWMLFSAGNDAFGGLYSNIFRISTIAMVIIGTIIYKKKRGYGLVINKKTIWMKDNYQG
ncbi:CPBP family intramembrane glutamic endopeptidase [Marinifilum sp. D737]|uniref:CPBP family intramembrane glutamic endopeptidase n=1 Tax=Marinifilum sp. D737 TaxID=2969628 RepID=UPI00227301FC|nr:type II CAAX endopeptidase family protein [Marinifilum sp. D737]MCY1635490.1 CPBP family intramembrane metalloprotease [Marinifilum sp. D737]